MNEVKKQARSLAEAVFSYARLRPEVSAVADKNGAYTYIRMWDEITLCAQVLEELGVKTGDRIVMECSQDVLFLAVNLSCQLTGAIFVGVERRVAPGRLKEIIEQAEPVLVLTRKASDMDVKNLSIKDFEALLKSRRAAEEADAGLRERRLLKAEAALKELDPEQIHEILYSTGTTGKSKGVMIANRANVANAQNIIDGTHMGQDAVELVPLPINHAHGLRTCYAHLLNGSTVLIANGITFPRLLFDMMNQYGANAIDLSPSAARMLVDTSAGKLKELAPSIEYVELGSAYLPEGTKQLLRECLPTSRLYNCYGSSESGRTCALDFSGESDMVDSVGIPVPNATFAVMGPDGQIMESDEDHTGLLATKGPMNMSGYWREPELTASTLVDGYVLTADMSYIDRSGCIHVLGRQDDVIVYKGIKISPEEIEEVVLGCSQVSDCALIPVADEVVGQVPKLYVVPADPDTFREEELFGYLKEHVDDNRMPRTIERIDEIPRTYNGKIKRKELVNRQA